MHQRLSCFERTKHGRKLERFKGPNFQRIPSARKSKKHQHGPALFWALRSPAKSLTSNFLWVKWKLPPNTKKLKGEGTGWLGATKFFNVWNGWIHRFARPMSPSSPLRAPELALRRQPWRELENTLATLLLVVAAYVLRARDLCGFACVCTCDCLDPRAPRKKDSSAKCIWKWSESIFQCAWMAPKSTEGCFRHVLLLQHVKRSSTFCVAEVYFAMTCPFQDVDFI